MRIFCLFKNELRVRIIANSDSQADQYKKLQVRDAVLDIAKKKPFNTSAIFATAKVLEPSAKMRRGILRFGGYASPAIEIRLGAGAGHNWWGILYPSAFHPEKEPIVFQSWILTVLRSWGWL